MKKNYFYLFLISLSVFFVSCQDESSTVQSVVDFEDVALDSTGYWNGSDGSGSFTSSIATFNNSFNTSWFTWSGFACSSLTDTTTAGWTNQYSVSAGSGADGSKEFALAFDSASVTIPSNANGNYIIKSLMITNSTYAYLDMTNGSDFSKKFSTDDWFKVNIAGYLNKVKQGSVDYYLADFRNGKSFISNKWVKVDLSSLGKVDSLSFTFDSSDKGAFGINTPTYACIDNIVFEQYVTGK